MLLLKAYKIFSNLSFKGLKNLCNSEVIKNTNIYSTTVFMTKNITWFIRLDF